MFLNATYQQVKDSYKLDDDFWSLPIQPGEKWKTFSVTNTIRPEMMVLYQFELGRVTSFTIFDGPERANYYFQALQKRFGKCQMMDGSPMWRDLQRHCIWIQAVDTKNGGVQLVAIPSH